MRNLRFRVWNKRHNKWMYGYEYPNLRGFALHGETTMLGGLNCPLEELNDIVEMQYTGLKDKNGVDIIEGDIIHYVKHKGYLLDSFVGEVIWLNEDAAFGYRAVGYDYPFNDADCIEQDILSHLSVIGNIFETPELLER